MDVNAFRSDIAAWRLERDFSQTQLDQACGFPEGTVGRIERLKRKVSEEELAKIFIALERDFVWSLLGVCGSVYRKLQPFEAQRGPVRGDPSSKPVMASQRTDDFSKGLGQMLEGIRVVLDHLAKTSDPRAWVIEMMLLASSQESSKVGRSRGRRKKRDGSNEG